MAKAGRLRVVMSPNSIMTIWRRMDWGQDVYIANIIIMYTRAKEIGRKVMAGEKKYDAACLRPDVVKYIAILVYGPLFRAF